MNGDLRQGERLWHLEPDRFPRRQVQGFPLIDDDTIQPVSQESDP